MSGRVTPAATKSSSVDLVTEFDRAAETAIVDWLTTHRPDDGIRGEEGTDVASSNGVWWHLDPIDGTTNFVYNQPAWCCSVGVSNDAVGDGLNGLVAGAVMAPVLDEMYSASLDGGATCNGEAVAVSDKDVLDQCLVATGFGYDPAIRRRQIRVVAELIDQVSDIRRLGSAAFDLCMVAAGKVDAYFEYNLNMWDCAAGALIAREAGAVTSNFAGGQATPTYMVAAAPGVHRTLLTHLPDLLDDPAADE